MFREPRIRKEKLFQTRAPKGYEYQPRYYDPEKERIAELKRRAGELNVSESDLNAGQAIRAGGMRRRRSQKGAQWAYLLRLILILAALMAFLGWFDMEMLR